MKINSWHVKNQQDVDKILNNLPKGKSEKRPDFVIKGISLYKYLSGLLEGNPEQCLWSEFIIPFHGLDTSNLSRLGIHYIIPTAKKAPLESYGNRVYSKLPSWRYQLRSCIFATVFLLFDFSF